ncbi:MAG: dihydrofolate reductase family protein [Anaerolineae bacterium]
MGDIIAFTNVTLDGVMQAPGRPDDDRRGGFQHGGWGAPYAAMEQAGDIGNDVDLLILGSGDLIHSLMRGGVVDKFILLIHPLVLGSGQRLFRDGGPATALQLVDTKMTTTGVAIVAYRTTGPIAAQNSPRT